MRKASNPQDRWRLAAFFLAALFVVYADQLSKLWVRSNLDIGQSLFEAGIFQIVRIQNTGSSFGLFQDHPFALIIVASIGIALLLFYALFAYRRYSIFDSRLGMIALGLILGGIIGNLIDRLRFGGVTDFISVGWWPAFNIADSALVVGAIIYAYSLLLSLVRKR
jgi:signal peptidase II